MSFETGHTKLGGRQKGTPNKATAAKVAEIAASGLTPLDYLLSIMRDEDRPTDERVEAAKAAAPYVHPKLASIQAKVEGGWMTHEERLAELEKPAGD
ncbi:MAG: hypothetical protein JO127_09995 [Caulobacteraceae bacterium]|nr:hypothetical protein [Caulobacteraceae bacterium]